MSPATKFDGGPGGGPGDHRQQHDQLQSSEDAPQQPVSEQGGGATSVGGALILKGQVGWREEELVMRLNDKQRKLDGQ